MCWWCSWWSARGCQGFHKEAWCEWDQVHKTWQLLIILRQIHQWQAQKLAMDFQRKRYQGKQLGLKEEDCFWWSGFFQWSNQKRHSEGHQSQMLREEVKICFSEDGVQVLKELFTGCARLNLSRVVGLFGFIYKVCYYLFNGVVYQVLRIFQVLRLYFQHGRVRKLSVISKLSCRPVSYTCWLDYDQELATAGSKSLFSSTNTSAKTSLSY